MMESNQSNVQLRTQHINKLHHTPETMTADQKLHISYVIHAKCVRFCRKLIFLRGVVVLTPVHMYWALNSYFVVLL